MHAEHPPMRQSDQATNDHHQKFRNQHTINYRACPNQAVTGRGWIMSPTPATAPTPEEGGIGNSHDGG